MNSPLPLLLLLATFATAVSAPAQESRPEPLVSTADDVVERIDLCLTKLTKLQEDGHWSDVTTTATVLLAFSGEGHSAGRGPHAKSVRQGVLWLSKQADPKTGLLGYEGQYDDFAHALALNAIADVAALDRSVVGKTITRRLVQGALTRQQEGGLWGAEKATVETTAQMLVGLSRAQAAGADVPSEIILRALGALDRITDEESGLVTPFKRAGAIDTTQATCAVVLAKLLHGKLPATDKLLGKSWKLMGKELDEKSRNIKLYLRAGDLEFWRWTLLCRFQMGADKSWRWTGFQRAAAAADAALDGDSEAPAMDLARSTLVFGAGYRYPPATEK
ncbi:hypothetical protein Poly30_35170 [Planctomycetes bacterium Poly30]|uniref:Prenyltransferase and squalene oxidase repeat protein n=1 Tax=Saltatorellus ferox TaxID=2528018 RepID=A0A518EV89_9BACT|nr:hypothetical protein Poly30_35170 [Planctomycetes bacterium Poly30]